MDTNKKEFLDEKALDIAQMLLPDLARANGPSPQGFDYVGICIDTRARYTKKIIDFIQSDILDLTPVGHDHYHTGNADCDWRGWNVGVVKRKWAVQMLALTGDAEAVQKMALGRKDRFSLLVFCDLGSSIMSMPDETWNAAIEAQNEIDPLISLRQSFVDKPS